MAEPVLMGRVSGHFGVKGWVKVYSYTEPREALLAYPSWLVRQGESWLAIKLEEGKRHGKTVIAKLEGYSDRDQAAALIDCDIGIRRDELPELEEGQYYFSDLEGLRVEHVDGSSLGLVTNILETGANDVLVVRTDDTERLIPFIVGQVVQSVDLEAGVIRVDWEWD
jgi:16S rRNA processing protein RimM